MRVCHRKKKTGKNGKKHAPSLGLFLTVWYPPKTHESMRYPLIVSMVVNALVSDSNLILLYKRRTPDADRCATSIVTSTKGRLPSLSRRSRRRRRPGRGAATGVAFLSTSTMRMLEKDTYPPALVNSVTGGGMGGRSWAGEGQRAGGERGARGGRGLALPKHSAPPHSHTQTHKQTAIAPDAMPNSSTRNIS